MNPMVAADLFRAALVVALKAAAPLMIAVTAAAVVIGVMQAATQIQDAAVSFAPKVVAALVVGYLGAPWMARVLTAFMRKALESIPWMVAS